MQQVHYATNFDQTIEGEPERSQRTALRIGKWRIARRHGGRFRVCSDESRAVRGMDEGSEAIRRIMSQRENRTATLQTPGMIHESARK
jgi:hypothetical protein